MTQPATATGAFRESQEMFQTSRALLALTGKRRGPGSGVGGAT
jgi:hypothetical protein